MNAIVAQFVGSYSILQILMFIIVIAAAIAILYIILQQMGIAIPEWATRIAWILLLAFVGIMALIFLFRMIGGMGVIG